MVRACVLLLRLLLLHGRYRCCCWRQWLHVCGKCVWRWLRECGHAWLPFAIMSHRLRAKPKSHWLTCIILGCWLRTVITLNCWLRAGAGRTAAGGVGCVVGVVGVG